MERLNIPIPQWIVRRRVRITRRSSTNHENHDTVLIEGRDPDNIDIPFSLFKSVEIFLNGKAEVVRKSEPYVVEFLRTILGPITIQLNFFGHYNEIPYQLQYDRLTDIQHIEEFYLFYNPMIGKWRKTTDKDDFPL